MPLREDELDKFEETFNQWNDNADNRSLLSYMRAAGLVEPKPREAGWYWMRSKFYYQDGMLDPAHWNGSWWSTAPNSNNLPPPRPIIEPTWIGPRIPEPGE